MKRLVSPAQVRRLDYDLVPTSHRAGQAHAHPDQEGTGRDLPLDRRRVSSDAIRYCDTPGVGRTQVMVVAAEYLTAESHGACRYMVSVDLDRDDIGPIRAGADEVGRPADAIASCRYPLADQAEPNEVGDNRRNRRAVETEQLSQVGASEFA